MYISTREFLRLKSFLNIDVLILKLRHYSTLRAFYIEILVYSVGQIYIC